MKPYTFAGHRILINFGKVTQRKTWGMHREMEKQKIRISVISDVVCPWCYIGKRRLEKAMEETAEFYDFEVEYFPFELNPHLPEEGVDYHAYLRSKFGSEARSLALSRHIQETALREGLHFQPALQKVSPNTRNAHRVILLAREDGKQSEIVERLFAAYFTEGIDISRIDNLVDLAVAEGMDREKIEPLLHSNTGKLEIEMAEKELHGLGITAVPLFIIDNKVAVSGAQPVEAFLSAFEEVYPRYTLRISNY